jgi:hypothetical protein
LRHPDHRGQVVLAEADLLEVVLDNFFEDVLSRPDNNEPFDDSIFGASLAGLLGPRATLTTWVDGSERRPATGAR